ncbi:hypothetical protein OFC51_35970, partial [Escherichia coli]|nr:hypothetical protein [Escherichia coli]
QTDLSKFKISLTYRASSRTAKTTQGNLVSKKKKTKKAEREKSVLLACLCRQEAHSLSFWVASKFLLRDLW